jgi:hypothetical protein
MSRVLRIDNGDYKVIVRSGGSITLDTGVETGEVIVTGDLRVLGNTTTVQSENLSIKDNLVILNQGETGAGVTLGTAGIQIDRGTSPAAQMLFDEANDQFSFGFANGNLARIRSTGVLTGGQNLLLIGSGNGVISVSGTNDYETRVTDDDHIPNRKFVIDTVSAATFSAVGVDDTRITFTEEFVGDPFSSIVMTIDGGLKFRLTNETLNVLGIVIDDNTIRSNPSNESLILESNGTAPVTMNSPLEITNASYNPVARINSNILYSTATIGTGGTGLYVVNSAKRDELASKTGALYYSLVFY